MANADAFVVIYGTTEPVQKLRQISVGSLSFLYSQDGLRRISWQGTELVRAIAWPIRDENWGTYPAVIVDERVEHGDRFEARLRFTVGDGRLECDLAIRATASGELAADLTMTPRGGAFSTNRAGFTVLHPIKGVAGQPLRVTHPDGSAEETSFPERIQPDQPVKNIRGLAYCVGVQSVEIGFEGEIFEMEDQRNWSDASYKTYCVPLVHPFTYDIVEPVRQSVRITLSGSGRIGSDGAQSDPVSVNATSRAAPKIGLALESGWLPSGAMPELGASAILLRTAPDADDLPQLARSCAGFDEVDLEIVLPDDLPVSAGLAKVATALAAEGVAPSRVIALRDAYLGSHQPAGPWPEGLTPNEMFGAVRTAFPGALVGGGMMTNFTELNRCRPDTTRCDYITHGLTPLVHAGDDLSVLETLEALPQIFASAGALAHGRPYRLGLASIGMRTNPYGAAVADNPAQIRRTMARVDPRHRGLFGAAFAAGILAATEGSTVEALCLAAPAGPFGLIPEPAAYPQAGYDGEGRAVYPLFHVVREACNLAGHPRLSVEGLPHGTVGLGAQTRDAHRLMLANLSDEPCAVTLPARAFVLRLDAGTFDDATRNADWLATAPRTQTADIELPPFSVAFVEGTFSSD